MLHPAIDDHSRSSAARPHGSNPVARRGEGIFDVGVAMDDEQVQILQFAGARRGRRDGRVYHVAFTAADGPFARMETRQALAMAIDRPSVSLQ